MQEIRILDSTGNVERVIEFDDRQSETVSSGPRMTADEGKLKARVSTILPLAEVKKAHQLSESGHTRGKIVLQIASDGNA
jgi:NADPH:quinone reductase-like Zn-dependent oxidoreductase